MPADPAKLARRRLLGGLPILALAAASGPARADAPGLAVTCDTTLGPALRKVGAAYKARSGVPVFVFPTGPGLILPQLTRDIQNDILVTQVSILVQAAQAGIVAAVPERPSWHNPLVIAGRRGADPTSCAFAATDPSPASDIDGPAVLARLGLQPASVLGAIDTDEVAFLLTSGVAQSGLLHMTDLRAAPSLDAVRPVPPEIQPPFVYAASVTRLARRPHPENLIAFLATPEAMTLLRDSGLEIPA
jgi:hypothetical protein